MPRSLLEHRIRLVDPLVIFDPAVALTLRPSADLIRGGVVRIAVLTAAADRDEQQYERGERDKRFHSFTINPCRAVANA